MPTYRPKPNPNEPKIPVLKALCPHCGNVSYQHIANDQIKYRLYKCDICLELTFQRVIRKQIEHKNARGKTIIVEEKLEQLYPPLTSLPVEVPERVRYIYDEAVSIRSKSPSSFVVQIRRALEAVANERKAPSGALHKQIEWMIKNNLLPDTFGKMIHITRIFGNLGAHDAEKDVSLEDTEIVDEFFRATIEYIYIAPAKVERVALLQQGDKKE
jgi:hypothetical protein